MGHKAVWFDIPVIDLARATKFYSEVLGIGFHSYEEPVPLAVMEHGTDDVAGCLVVTDETTPSDHGPLLYFPVNNRLDEAAGLVEGLGGKILAPPHDTPPYGSRCIVLDSEGNRICLHSE